MILIRFLIQNLLQQSRNFINITHEEMNSHYFVNFLFDRKKRKDVAKMSQRCHKEQGC
jgi:hypothetical protein